MERVATGIPGEWELIEEDEDRFARLAEAMQDYGNLEDVRWNAVQAGNYGAVEIIEAAMT